jgi:hypothetical protein
MATMTLSDVEARKAAIIAGIQTMPAEFHVKDLSGCRIVCDSFGALCNHSHYHALLGKYLKANQAALGIEIMPGCGSSTRGERYRRLGVPRSESFGEAARERDNAQTTRSASASRAVSASVVRRGHYATLEYMASPEFCEVKALFESYPEIGGVYFRPTDKGVTVCSLDASGQKPLIGVGRDPNLSCWSSSAQVAQQMSERIQALKEKQANASASREKQFEALLIRQAQGDHLRLPGFPERLRFIHSQWRMDRAAGGTAQLTDLIAVDLPSGRMVLIELKAAPDYSAVQQVQQYLAYFQDHGDELKPFFARVARVMGALYGSVELAALAAVEDPVVTMVAWPGASGAPVVIGAEQLSRAA